MKETFKKMDTCSSTLSENRDFYNSDESCDYSGYSHDYHCSKCSKPHAVIESRLAALHRANERLKLVDSYVSTIKSLDLAKLAKNSTKEDKMIAIFVENNEPDPEYRLANKFYKAATLKWQKIETKPEMEDLLHEILITLQTTSNDYTRVLQRFKETIIESDSKQKKTQVKEKLDKIYEGFLTEKSRQLLAECRKFITQQI